MKQHTSRFLNIVHAAKTQIVETNVDAVKKQIDAKDDFHLIDVREDNEWARGHLPGAIHIGKGVIERDIERRFPDPTTKLVLYCGGGYRSALAAASLNSMGYTNVQSMDGGISGWCERGYPLEG